tara:strand:- start:614 stop:853 length:240 start_codon:yes stop_codon:yes gene_type:complete
MRITIQLCQENRITFFTFDPEYMDIVKITKNFVKNFGDCTPKIIEATGLTPQQETQLKHLIQDLVNIYQANQPQMKLQF